MVQYECLALRDPERRPGDQTCAQGLVLMRKMHILAGETPDKATDQGVGSWMFSRSSSSARHFLWALYFLSVSPLSVAALAGLVQYAVMSFRCTNGAPTCSMIPTGVSPLALGSSAV